MGLFNKNGNKPNGYTHESRQIRHRKKRIVLLTIFSLIILLLMLFSFVVFNEAITSCRGKSPIDTNDTSDTTAETETEAVTDTTEVDIVVAKSCFSCTGIKKPKDKDDSTSTTKKLTYKSDSYVVKNSSDVKKGELLLINNNHLYEFPNSTPNIFNLYDKRTEFPDGVRSIQVITQQKPKLDIKAIDALNAMADAFYNATNQEGLQAKYGYFTKAEQQAFFDKAVSDYGSKEAAMRHEAVAGGTEYNTGLAVCLGVYTNGNTYKLNDPALDGKYNWIYENCYKYGFILRFPDSKISITRVDYEPFQFRYVGYEHAFYMHKNNLCFEEYLDLLRGSYTCTTENVETAAHLIVKGDNGLKYEIYYVEANAAETIIPVPNNAPYTISGDNVSGFIVSVTVG